MALFFFNDTAPTEIYTLSLHDALPISSCCAHIGRRCAGRCGGDRHRRAFQAAGGAAWRSRAAGDGARSEEHTSELQSHVNLVCRLLLEKKKKKNSYQ